MLERIMETLAAPWIDSPAPSEIEMLPPRVEPAIATDSPLQYTPPPLPLKRVTVLN